MLPEKTFMTKNCSFSESDFDACGRVKPASVMRKMQDLATEHAEKLGFGWKKLDGEGLFWVLSKVKIAFYRAIDRNNRDVVLYTWPIAANKFFVERRFEAVSNGETVFSACTIWMLLDKKERKIAGQSAVEKIYCADFDDAPCECDSNFERVRKDGSYTAAYDKTILRGDIDINGHVNNTCYATYVTDVLRVDEIVESLEITYNKELSFKDKVRVCAKREGSTVCVVGEKDGETCFSSKLKIAAEN